MTKPREHSGGYGSQLQSNDHPLRFLVLGLDNLRRAHDSTCSDPDQGIHERIAVLCFLVANIVDELSPTHKMANTEK
jgi:hypothetical protein